MSESLALQNLQARLRMCLSYYYVQLVTAMRGNSAPLLVIATGNCDEGLSGYFTKYDCSSGDLNPIGSICKNDLKKFVRFMMDKYPFLHESLKSIVEAIPAAELEPSIEGIEPQTDEADMGITYEELDTLGKLRSLNRCGPYSMFTRLCSAFPSIPPAQHYSRVAFFFRKYAAYRHKMTVLPPAYHAMATSPDDNRFDLRPFLYSLWSWEWQFRRIEKDLAEI